MAKSSPSTELPAVAARLVKRTCAAQGIPEQLTDPATLRRLAALVVASPAR